MTKKKSLVRVISLCLILALMLGGMPVVALDNATAATTTAPADTADRTVTEAALPDAEESLLGPGELSYAALQTAVLAPTDIPDALPAGAVEAKGHVNRVYEQEVGLSHLLFQNRDGGKTAYFYGTPIKYVAADGSVRDKSKTLIAVNKTYGALGYDYGVEDNSFRQYYAQDPATGVLLELGEGSVRIIPQPIGSLVVPRGVLRENTFVYNHIFGNTTALVYTPQLSGVKEDIVLRSFAGVSDFTFTYRTSGLSLIELDGTYTLVDESGFPQATLGAVVLIDAEGKRAGGSLTVTETANGVYTVTVHADRTFLTNPSTVYPVTVDPSVTIPETVTGNAAIIDHGLYSSTALPSYTNLYNYLGHTNSGGTVGRIIYKFPHFVKGNALSEYTYLNGYQISAADLILCGEEVDGWPGTNVTAYPLTMSWSSSSNAFSSTPLFNSCKNGTPTSRGSVSFDYIFSNIGIVNILKAWANYNAGDTTQPNPAYGLVLVDDNELNTGYAKRVLAAEGAEEDLFLTFDYSTMPAGKFFICNLGTGRMLQRTSSTGTAGYYNSSNVANQRWIVEYKGGGQHVIQLQSNPSLYLAANGSSLTLSSSANDARSRWIMTGNSTSCMFTNASTNTVLCNDGSSLSLVAARNTGASNYNNTRWLLSHTDGFVMLEDFTLTGRSFTTPGSTTYFTIHKTPSSISLDNSIFYTWSTSNTAFTFPSFGSVKAPATGGYTTITVTHKPSQVTKTFVLKSGVVEEGIYRFRNRETGQFITSSGLYANISVKQYAMSDGLSQKWQLTLLQNGEYSIQSLKNSMYIGVDATSSATTPEIIQWDNADSVYARWRIEKIGDTGFYRMTSAYYAQQISNGYIAEADRCVLSAPNNQSGDALIEAPYGVDTDYRDTWDFYEMKYTLAIYYDNSVARNSDMVDKIAQAAQFACDVYSKAFGIKMVVKGTPVHYTNAIQDKCTPIDSHCSECTVIATNESCGTDCDQHHKNIGRMNDELYETIPRGNNEISIMWSDRPGAAYCFPDYAFQSEVPYILGMVVPGRRSVIQMLQIHPEWNGDVEVFFAIALIHELAHTFGMSDVYGTTNHVLGDSVLCVMDAYDTDNVVEIYNNLSNWLAGNDEDASPFCNTCTAFLAPQTGYTIHHGNFDKSTD